MARNRVKVSTERVVKIASLAERLLDDSWHKLETLSDDERLGVLTIALMLLAANTKEPMAGIRACIKLLKTHEPESSSDSDRWFPPEYLLSGLPPDEKITVDC